MPFLRRYNVVGMILLFLVVFLCRETMGECRADNLLANGISENISKKQVGNQKKSESQNFQAKANGRKSAANNKTSGICFSRGVKLFSCIVVYSDLYIQDSILGDGAIRMANKSHSVHIYADKASISHLILSPMTKVALDGELNIRKRLTLEPSSILQVLANSSLLLNKGAILQLDSGAGLIYRHAMYISQGEVLSHTNHYRSGEIDTEYQCFSPVFIDFSAYDLLRLLPFYESFYISLALKPINPPPWSFSLWQKIKNNA